MQYPAGGLPKGYCRAVISLVKRPDIREVRLRRLSELIEKRFQGKRGRLADRLGKKRSQIYRLFSTAASRRGLGEEQAREIEDELKLPTRWLDEEYENELPDEEGVDLAYVRLLQLDIDLSAGPGREPVDYPEVLRHVDVLEEWVRTELRTDPAKIRITTARGDSMKGAVDDGDIVFVDVTVRHYVADAVYAVIYDGQLQIKRLENMMDGRLAIKSDNKRYAPKFLSSKDADRLQVCGLVKGRWLYKRV